MRVLVRFFDISFAKKPKDFRNVSLILQNRPHKSTTYGNSNNAKLKKSNLIN